jgi:ECF transporter S component (folate family)
MEKNSVPSVFTAKYWTIASSEFRNIRSLVIAGLTIALSTVLSSLYIPVGLNLRITFAFVALAFGSMTFGPVVGLVAGLAYDLVGYIIIPSTVFFPGYTLSSILEFFIYGIFLTSASSRSFGFPCANSSSTSACMSVSVLYGAQSCMIRVLLFLCQEPYQKTRSCSRSKL